MVVMMIIILDVPAAVLAFVAGLAVDAADVAVVVVVPPPAIEAGMQPL